MSRDDGQLLAEFVERGSQAAFAELSARYVNLVYSSALRQMGDAHGAEDVAQAVFIVLARKAGGLKRDVILSSWLLQTTAYAVKNARRAKLRRRHHEQEAAKMKTPVELEEGEAVWEQISPAIDAAVRSLGTTYRDAVVLRYFDGKSYEEVARRLAISEAAARQRISRGVAELRTILGKRGVVAPAVSAAAVAGALEVNAVKGAPAHLAATCAAAPAMAVAAPMVIAKGVMIMFLVKKMAMAASLALLLLIGAGVVVAAKGGAGAQADEASKPQKVDGHPMRPPVEGRVVDTDGKPLAGAQVYLADPHHPVTVYSDEQARAAWVEVPSGHAGQAGYDHHPANRLFTVTDGQGKFRFEAAEIPPLDTKKFAGVTKVKGAFPPESFALVVASENGFAHLMPDEFKAAGNQIAVSAWGQIEGTLSSEGKPLPHVPVRLSRMTHLWEGFPFLVQYEDQVNTDDRGHYRFAQVAPGDAWLTHSASGAAMGIGDHAAYVRVEPGKTHQVDLGKGRPVIGQLVEPENVREKIIWVDTYHHTGGTMRIQPYPVWEQPADWFQFSSEERAKRYARWSASEEGRIHNENLFPFQVDVHPDGSFRIADVPAGAYKLSLSTYEGGRARELLGGLSAVVQIEPIAAGKPADVQDLGRLTMTIKERLQVGDVAPEFAVNRLDGKGQIKLSDYKGKLLVLQFWSSELPAEAMDLKYLKSVAALAEQQKEKLAMVGIGLGRDNEYMRKMVGEAGMSWPQGGTEQWSKTANDYHVTLYGLFLIGPDGKILSRQMSEREIMPAVQKALESEKNR